MFAVFAGVIASLIGLAGFTSREVPAAMPQGTIVLAHSQAGIPVPLELTSMRPESEVKFDNIARQEYDYSCGSAALVTILQFDLGLDVTEKHAIDGMLEHGERDKIISRRGFSLLDMKRYLASRGIESAGYRIETDDLGELKRPSIVTINYGGFKHFVVLRAIRGGRAHIADPALGHFVVGLETFKEWRDRDTVFVVKPPAGTVFKSKLALNDIELSADDSDLLRTGVDFDFARAQLLEQTIDASSSGGWLRRR